MADLPPRVRAVCDLDVAGVRENSGRHEYDGFVQDLSPDGVRHHLARLAEAVQVSGRLADPHEEAHLAAFEKHARVAFGDLELHRRSLWLHLDALDLACYERDYAPADERDRARLAHLAVWPDAVDCALAALDQLSSPVATAMLGGIRGLAAGIPVDAPDGTREAAAGAHARLTAFVERAATNGEPDPALGDAGLTALMGSVEGMDVDLGRLAERADAERDRLLGLLATDCARIDATRAPLELARELVREHPDPRASSTRRPSGPRKPSTSPGNGTWSPTTTASAWSGWRPSPGGGPWP